MDDIFEADIKHRKYCCRASVTVEASFVLGIVFITFALLLRQAYIKHDTVTGALILEEVIIAARMYEKENLQEDKLENEGEKRGNPRLWLGEYEMDIHSGKERVYGTAASGNWNLEIDCPVFQPGSFLRRTECMEEILGYEEEDENHES